MSTNDELAGMKQELAGMKQELALLRQQLAAYEDRANLDRKELLAKLDNTERALSQLFGVEEQRVQAAQRKTTMAVAALKAVWDKGGQWVILAICLWLVSIVRGCSSTSAQQILDKVVR